MSEPEKCRSCGRELPVKGDDGREWYPFCSQRCRWVDLGGWLDQKYRLSEGNGLGEGPDGDEKGSKSEESGQK